MCIQVGPGEAGAQGGLLLSKASAVWASGRMERLSEQGREITPPQFFFIGRAKICDYLEITEERGELWQQGKENKQQQVLGKTL